MHRFFRVVFVLVSAVVASCETTGPFWWNQVNGNARSTSFIAIRTTDAILPVWTERLWSTTDLQPDDIYPSDPVVALDSAIVVSGSRAFGLDVVDGVPRGRVKCFEHDGTVRFDVPVPLDVVSTPAIAPDGRILVTLQSTVMDTGTIKHKRRTPQLLCLDRLTGALLWSHRFGDGTDWTLGGTAISAPKIRGDHLFVSINYGGFNPALFVFDFDGVVVASIPLPCDPSTGGSVIEASAGQACFTLPPAITGKHPFSNDGPLVVQAGGVHCWMAFSWDPTSKTLGTQQWTATDGVRTAGSISEDGEIAFQATGLEVFVPPATAAVRTSTFSGSVFATSHAPSLWEDRADFLVYIAAKDMLWSLAPTTSFFQALEHPSPATVTRTRVHVSDANGLHTFNFALANSSHVVGTLSPLASKTFLLYRIPPPMAVSEGTP